MVSGNGKRVEKAQIAKSGNGYIAKREDASQSCMNWMQVELMICGNPRMK